MPGIGPAFSAPFHALVRRGLRQGIFGGTAKGQRHVVVVRYFCTALNHSTYSRGFGGT